MLPLAGKLFAYNIKRRKEDYKKISKLIKEELTKENKLENLKNPHLLDE